MLDINLIRNDPDLVRQAFFNRQLDPAPIDDVLKLDIKRRAPHPRGGDLKGQA